MQTALKYNFCLATQHYVTGVRIAPLLSVLLEVECYTGNKFCTIMPVYTHVPNNQRTLHCMFVKSRAVPVFCNGVKHFVSLNRTKAHDCILR